MAVTTSKNIQERTWKIVINSPFNREHSVTIFREAVDEDYNVTKRPNKTFTFSEISADVFDTVGETDYTVEDLSEALAAYCDAKCST